MIVHFSLSSICELLTMPRRTGVSASDGLQALSSHDHVLINLRNIPAALEKT